MSTEGQARRRPLHQEEEKEEREDGQVPEEGAEGDTDWGVDDEGWTRDGDGPETAAERQVGRMAWECSYHHFANAG